MACVINHTAFSAPSFAFKRQGGMACPAVYKTRQQPKKGAVIKTNAQNTNAKICMPCADSKTDVVGCIVKITM